MPLGQHAAVGRRRNLPAGPGIALQEHLAALSPLGETELLEADQLVDRIGIVDLRHVDVLGREPGLLEGHPPRLGPSEPADIGFL